MCVPFCWDLGRCEQAWASWGYCAKGVGVAPSGPGVGTYVLGGGTSLWSLGCWTPYMGSVVPRSRAHPLGGRGSLGLLLWVEPFAQDPGVGEGGAWVPPARAGAGGASSCGFLAMSPTRPIPWSPQQAGNPHGRCRAHTPEVKGQWPTWALNPHLPDSALQEPPSCVWRLVGGVPGPRPPPWQLLGQACAYPQLLQAH